MLFPLGSPIDRGGDRYLLTFHMLQHLLLALVGPPLLLLGLPEQWRAGASPHASGAGGARRAFETFLDRVHISPLAANVVFNVVLAAWHLPFLYEATLRNQPVHVLEHLSFIAVGGPFWC